MSPRFVFEGRARLKESPEFQARVEELRQRLAWKYRPALERAGWFQRLVIRWSQHREYRRERARLLPSGQALFNRA